MRASPQESPFLVRPLADSPASAPPQHHQSTMTPAAATEARAHISTVADESDESDDEHDALIKASPTRNGVSVQLSIGNQPNGNTYGSRHAATANATGSGIVNPHPPGTTGVCPITGERAEIIPEPVRSSGSPSRNRWHPPRGTSPAMITLYRVALALWTGLCWLIHYAWLAVSWLLYIAISILLSPIGIYAYQQRKKLTHNLTTKYDITNRDAQRSLGMAPGLYEQWKLKDLKTGDYISDSAFAEIVSIWDFRSTPVTALQQRAAERGPESFSAKLLDELATPPAWVDFEQIAIARRLFWRTTPFYLLALCMYSFSAALLLLVIAGLTHLCLTACAVLIDCYSLPLPYTCGAGVAILGLTGRLKDDNNRRLYETLQIVVDLFSDVNGLESVGIQSVAKTRLMHSLVRRNVIKHHSGYMTKFNCTPINQIHMAAMLAGFSYHVIQFARMFGIQISDEEHRAHVHTWRYFGYVLGIEEKHWVPSMEAEPQWARMFYQFDCTPTDVSRSFMRALIGMLLLFLPPSFVLHFICRFTRTISFVVHRL
jgi:hypothetical protein